MARHTYRNLIQRAVAAGFKSDFIRDVLLPDWWNRECEKDASLLPEVEIRLARFLGTSIEAIRDPAFPLNAPEYPGAQLRRVQNVNRDRLRAAIHAGLRVASAVVRCLRSPDVPIRIPFAEPLRWREDVGMRDPTFGLKSVVEDLWSRGIPVIHLEKVPPPKFQGLACVVRGRPVILLGHANDEPVRLLLYVAHETSHIVRGDVGPDVPVVDEDELFPDTSEMELAAEEYAWKALTGGQPILAPPSGNALQWANAAWKDQQSRAIDAGVSLWKWANQQSDFAKGEMALKALYRAQGGQRTLREVFDQHVAWENASETDRELLRSVFLDPDGDATTG